MSIIQNSINEFIFEQTGSITPHLYQEESEGAEGTNQHLLVYSGYNTKDMEALKSHLNKTFQELKEQSKEGLVTQLHEKFKAEYANNSPYFEDISHGRLKAIFEEVSNNFFKLNPKLMTVALTYDQSMHFTTIFEKERIYLEVFLDEEAPDCYTSIYSNKNKVDEVSGEDIDTTFSKLTNYFENGNTEDPIKVWNGKYGDLPQPFATQGILSDY